MLFIHPSLNGDGSVDAVSTGTVTSFIGGQGYVGPKPLCTTVAVADSDSSQGGFRRSAAGALRLFDATLGLPSSVYYQEGIAVTGSGQVCALLGSVTADVVSLAGLAVTNDGRPYINLT